MENTFADRVREYRKHQELSQQAFAARGGLEQGNITQMEKGTEPKQRNVSKLLAGFPDLSPSWLLLGTGPMLLNGREAPPPPSRPAPTPGLTSGPATVAEAENVLLREVITELRADKARLSAQVDELLGKSPGSPDAADYPTPPPAPGPRLLLSIQHRRRPRRPIGFVQGSR